MLFRVYTWCIFMTIEISHYPSTRWILIVSINSQDGWEDEWSSGEIAKKWLTWFQEGGRKYTQEKRPQFKPRGQWSQGIGDHHWLSSSKLDHILSFSGQAWGGVLIWEANVHSSYAREVPKTILILVWIGFPLENWCMCVCIVWIRYLELIMKSLVVDQTLWWWHEVRRKGETKNQPHREF